MYNHEAKEAMERLHQRMSPELIERIAEEIIKLGAGALKLALTFPEVLIYPAMRRWLARVALRMNHDEVLPVLFEGRAHPDWRIFQIARHALVPMGAEITTELVENLKTCPAPAGRVQTLYCLHRRVDPFGPLEIGDKSLIAPIAEVAESDESAEVRACAITVLSRSEAAEASATIVKALDDDSEEVRLAAAVAAGRLRLTEAVPALVKMLSHADAEVRADVVNSLDRIGRISAAPAVRKCLTDGDWYVRWTAATALRSLWEPANVDALKKCASDEHEMVAIAAAETLAIKAGGEATDSLAEARAGNRPGLAEMAEFYSK